MPNTRLATVEDWRRLREILLREEAGLVRLVEQERDGPTSTETVGRQRAQVLALRELCESVLDRLLKEDRQARRSNAAPKRPDSAHRGQRESIGAVAGEGSRMSSTPPIEGSGRASARTPSPPPSEQPT